MLIALILIKYFVSDLGVLWDDFSDQHFSFAWNLSNQIWKYA